MFARVFGLFTLPIGSRLETFLVENAKNILKPRMAAQPPDAWYLTEKHSEGRTIEDLDVTSELEPLIAHKLQLSENAIPAKNPIKKAIIYLPGNCPVINDSLPIMEGFLRNLRDEMNTNVACFCQHYRGRGANKNHAKENFNDYPIFQDAKDQALLIKKLVDEEGYQPEDITLLGYSYGSAVALWSIYYLATEFGLKYTNLKFFSDRGFGNLFDFPYIIKPFIYDQEKAHQRLYEKMMMPIVPLHDIAAWLPDSFIFYIENDRSIWTDISLANTFKTDEMPERVWMGQAENIQDPHFAKRGAIHLKTISELKPHHFMAAILNETPIKLHFDCALLEQVSGYAFKKDAVPGEVEFITLPNMRANKEEKIEVSDLTLSVTSSAVSTLITQLHEYCCNRAGRARMSGYGGEYKKDLLGSTGLVGWTAKEQVQMAIRIMASLCDANGPDVENIKKLQQEKGPHQSGGLYKIFMDVMRFVEEYSRLQRFNQWAASMSLRRNERVKNEYSRERAVLSKIHESLVEDWHIIEEGDDKSHANVTVRI